MEDKTIYKSAMLNQWLLIELELEEKFWCSVNLTFEDFGTLSIIILPLLVLNFTLFPPMVNLLLFPFQKFPYLFVILFLIDSFLLVELLPNFSEFARCWSGFSRETTNKYVCYVDSERYWVILVYLKNLFYAVVEAGKLVICRVS